jgi:hypothetical protein
MRLATAEDRGALVEACKRLAAYAVKYKWVGEVDYEKGLTALFAEVDKGNAYVIEGYIVFVDEITPWYTQDRLLQEWLVMRLHYVHGELSKVPSALLAIAKARACVGVLGNDSSPVPIVAAAYEGDGWLALTKSYFKEVS